MPKEVIVLSNIYTVGLQKLVEEFALEPVFKASDYDVVQVTVDDVSRPGLQIAGFFDHFEPIDPELVPKDSLLREFIGGGSYKYK